MKSHRPTRRKPFEAFPSRTTNVIMLLIAASTFFGAPVWVPAWQQQGTERQPEMRINKAEPSVFISYDHEGKREPLKATESDRGIWLKLHNNTKTALFFASFSVPEALGEVGMFYEIVPTFYVSSYRDPSRPLKNTEAEDLPTGYTLGHTSSGYLLGPGRSVLFSVPREHLPEGVALRIAFNYRWELEGEGDYVRVGEPQHSVYFYSSHVQRSSESVPLRPSPRH